MGGVSSSVRCGGTGVTGVGLGVLVFGLVAAVVFEIEWSALDVF